MKKTRVARFYGPGCRIAALMDLGAILNLVDFSYLTWRFGLVAVTSLVASNAGPTYARQTGKLCRYPTSRSDQLSLAIFL